MEYVCTTDGRKSTSVLTGLVRLGEKLLLNLLVLVLMDLNWRLDGRGSNRSWAGWDELSYTKHSSVGDLMRGCKVNISLKVRLH